MADLPEMAPLEHFLLTNFNVHRDDRTHDRSGTPVSTAEWLEERFLLFERFCLPSVVAQTCLDFTWLVRYDDAGTPPDQRRRLLEHEAAFANLQLVPERVAFWREIASRINGRARRVLTTRLDNDDALHRGAVALIQRHGAGNDPEFLNLTLGYCHSHPDGRTFLVEEPSNPFLSLAESVDGDPPRTAVCVGHHQAEEVAPVRQIGREPSWLQVVHGRNLTNYIRGRPCDSPDLAGSFNVGGATP